MLEARDAELARIMQEQERIRIEKHKQQRKQQRQMSAPAAPHSQPHVSLLAHSTVIYIVHLLVKGRLLFIIHV